MAEDNQELTQQDFQKAVSGVCSTFGVQKLYPQQEKALSEFLSGNDVFVNLPTGYGKSLIQCRPEICVLRRRKTHARFLRIRVFKCAFPNAHLMRVFSFVIQTRI